MGNGQFSIYIDKELVEEAREKYAKAEGEELEDVKLSHVISKALKMMLDSNPVEMNLHSLFSKLDNIEKNLNKEENWEDEYWGSFLGTMRELLSKDESNQGGEDEP